MKKYKYTTTFTFDGKRYYIRADTKDKLIEKKTNRLRDLEEGKITHNGNTKARDWAYTAVNTYKSNRTAKSIKNMLWFIDRFITPAIGTQNINSVKAIQCQEIMNSSSGMAASTISELYQILFFVFDTAKRNKLILENPAENITKPSGHKRANRALTTEEIRHFLKACDTDPRFTLYLLMYYCGCRPSEAMACKGEDIENIIVDGKVVRVLHIHGTKTASADRKVPIPDVLYEKIKDTNKDAYIAPHGNEKHTPTSYKRLNKALRRAMNISMGATVYRNKIVESKLNDDFRPYYLRHTFCTNLCKYNVDVRTAQKLMGHADIQTTANIYTHASDDMYIDIAEKMGATVGATSEQ